VYVHSFSGVVEDFTSAGCQAIWGIFDTLLSSVFGTWRPLPFHLLVFRMPTLWGVKSIGNRLRALSERPCWEGKHRPHPCTNKKAACRYPNQAFWPSYICLFARRAWNHFTFVNFGWEGWCTYACCIFIYVSYHFCIFVS
jgi:hypothetical protein